MMKKKSICFIVSSPMTANVFLQKHFEVLTRNYDLYLVANFDTFKFNNSSCISGTFNLNIKRNINILSDIISIYKLTKYLNNYKFDAVHTITPKAGLIGMIAAFICRIKFRIHIFTGQVWHTKKGLYRFLLQIFDKLIVKLATNIIVDGNSQRNYLIKNNIVSINKSIVLGAGSISGVDLNKFISDKNLKNNLRLTLGIKEDIVVYSFLGRLNFEKGVIDLVKAFINLRVKYNNIRLVIIGFDEGKIINYIKELFDTTDIIFIEDCDKPEDYLQIADIFCMPSYREGFGTSILEASSLEIPIISSDTYGLLDTIIVNKTGLRHEVGNVNDLTIKMEYLLLDKNTREILGKNGRQYVLNNFSANSISNEWLSFYKTLLK